MNPGDGSRLNSHCAGKQPDEQRLSGIDQCGGGYQHRLDEQRQPQLAWPHSLQHTTDHRPSEECGQGNDPPERDRPLLICKRQAGEDGVARHVCGEHSCMDEPNGIGNATRTGHEHDRDAIGVVVELGSRGIRFLPPVRGTVGHHF